MVKRCQLNKVLDDLDSFLGWSLKVSLIQAITPNALSVVLYTQFYNEILTFLE